LGERDRNIKPPTQAPAARGKASLAQASGSSSYHHHITQPQQSCSESTSQGTAPETEITWTFQFIWHQEGVTCGNETGRTVYMNSIS